MHCRFSGETGIGKLFDWLDKNIISDWRKLENIYAFSDFPRTWSRNCKLLVIFIGNTKIKIKQLIKVFSCYCYWSTSF